MPNRTPAAGSRSTRYPSDYTDYSDYYYEEEPQTVRHALPSTRTSQMPPRPPMPRQAPRRGPVRRRRRRANPLGTTIGIAVLLILAAAGAYAGYLYKNSSALRRYAGAVLSDATVANQFPGVNGINLMIVGRDDDYNNQDQVIKTHARSDMLMIAHIDFASKTARILSIPRDTAVEIPGHGVTKINAAHAYGGPQLSCATIQQNFGIASDHYISLDFQGFQEAIDKLGGVDTTVDKKMDYDDNWGHLHIHLLPGYQHLSGEQAMDFVRFRHSDSDLIRTQRQQTLLASLKEKLVQPQTLALVPALLDTVDRHIDSDLTDGQKVALAKFLHELPKQNVQMVTLPSIQGGELVQTDRAQAAPVVKSMFGIDLPQTVPTARLARTHRHHRHHHLAVLTGDTAQAAPNIYD